MRQRPLLLLALALLALPGIAFLRIQLPQQGTTLEGIEAAEGVEAVIFAQAPMVVNPIAMDVDTRGRVWVTEGHNYRNSIRPNYPVRQEGDRILILEDTDGDGRADSQKIFYQGSDVNSAMGITVLGNRVIVAAYENIYLFTDTNGDDRADEKRVIYKRARADHDHTTHSFVFGPDGRFYFNAGDAGGALRDSTGATVLRDRAGNEIRPDSGAYRRGLVFRVNQDFTTGLEVLGHNFRNPFELALDSYGSIWQSDNDDDGNRAVRINHVMEFGNYGYRDEMTGAQWRTRRVNMETEIPLQHWFQNDPGVVPNVLQTGGGSPAGITFYEGDLLPEVFRNAMIHADAGVNVVRAYPVVPSGAGYTGRMVNLLRGTGDRMFRPIDVAPAPDGSLFVSDWYDQGVGGHAAQDFVQGRIIRLAPRGAANRYVVPRLDVSNAAAAAQALRNPAPSVRHAAYTRLVELGAGAEATLRQMWGDRNPAMRARALWILARLPNGTRYVDEALRDANPDIRITGLRAARMLDRNVLSYAQRLASDPSPQVRREVAVALRYERGPEAARVWTQLARQHDGADRYYLEALGVAADGKWDTFLPAWRTAVGEAWREKAGRDIVWRARTEQALPLVAQLIQDSRTPAAERERYFRALDFYRGPARERTLAGIVEAPNTPPATAALALMALDSAGLQVTPELRAAVGRALDGTRGTAQFVTLASKFDARDRAADLLQLAMQKPDSAAGVEAARLAIRWNGLEPFRQAALGADTAAARRAVLALSYVGGYEPQRVLEQVVLDPSRPLALRQAAVLAFPRIAGGGAPAVQPGQPPYQFGDRRLLQLVQAGNFPADLNETAAGVLFRSTRADVRAGAAQTSLTPPSTRTADGRVLPPVADLAARTGDPALGRAAFDRACAMCHQVQGRGIDFGPALTEIGSKLPKAALYTAIFEPSQGVAFNYEGSIVRMRDGREVTGIVVDNTATEVAVKVIGGITTRYNKGDVALVLPMDVSLMPDHLETALTEAELVGVVEYMAALRAPR